MMPHGHAIGEERSEESTQQAADALKDAAQQPEDAGQEATNCTAEAAENSHLNSSPNSRGSCTQDTGPDARDASSRDVRA
jgi:hypothetical protein